MTTADPGAYLDAADQMLSGTGDIGSIAVTEGWWPRACACLIRLGLEAGITAYWRTVDPAVAHGATGRIRLLLLRRRLPMEVARQAAYVWVALSRCTHHHCYEAAPSVGELRRLLTATLQLVSALEPERRALP